MHKAWGGAPAPMALHIGIDAQTLPVRAICVTSNNVSDAAVMPELLAQVSAQEPLLTAIAQISPKVQVLLECGEMWMGF